MSDFILTRTEDHVGVATLNRPEVLNVLSVELVDQLIAAIEAFDSDPNIYVVVIAGSEKAFVAGADIGDMADASVLDMYNKNNLARWLRIKAIRMPIIAAVSGFALGGGCELAMHCDIIVASESAQFGQPEINLGIMPDAGRLSEGAFELTGGFWFEVPPGDCTHDCGVEIHDFLNFYDCMAGPNADPGSARCNCLDCGGDVDLVDMAEFQASFTGN